LAGCGAARRSRGHQDDGASMSPLLEVDNVGKVFTMGGAISRRRVEAVHDADFELAAERPEIFTIIGESGSGKTTLARMILGLERPTTGAIRFRGQPVSANLTRPERLAFMASVQPVFQNPFE